MDKCHLPVPAREWLGLSLSFRCDLCVVDGAKSENTFDHTDASTFKPHLTTLATKVPKDKALRTALRKVHFNFVQQFFSCNALSFYISVIKLRNSSGYPIPRSF